MKMLRLALLVTLMQLAFIAPLLYYHDVLAGLINRSTKAGSTTSFATSNSLGNTLAVADLDTDLDTVYSLVNGALDANNLAADSVEASELADNSVASANIIAGSIVDSDVNASAAIAGTKLGVAAGLRGMSAGTAYTGNSTLGGGESTLVLTGSTTMFGGATVWWTTGYCWIQFPNIDITSAEVRIRFYEDSTIRGTFSSLVNMPAQGSLTLPFMIPPFLYNAPVAGAHTFKVTAEWISGTGNPSIDCGTLTNPPNLYVVEIR